VKILFRCCVILSSLKLLIKWLLLLIKRGSARALMVASIKLTLPRTAPLYLLGIPSRKKRLKSITGPTLQIVRALVILETVSSKIVLLVLLVLRLTLLRTSQCAVIFRRLMFCWMVNGNVVRWLTLVLRLPC
jgi:hypothetical protein